MAAHLFRLSEIAVSCSSLFIYHVEMVYLLTVVFFVSADFH